MKFDTLIRKRILLYLLILKSTWNEFLEDNGIKLSASLAYYTIFSLAPMLVVIISLGGLFLGKQAIAGELFEQIRRYVGDAAALQIQNMIGDADVLKSSFMASIIGIGTMLIGATGVFVEIQDSLNFMWGIKHKHKRGFVKYLLNRLISFVIVIGMGLVLLITLAINSIIDSFSSTIVNYFPFFPLEFASWANSIIMFVILCLLFAVIFKFLPDAIIYFKDALIGALFTAVLFMMGKWAISYYLGVISLGTTYGAAASLVIILLWVYYSAIILYFGAEFTHSYAIHAGRGIKEKYQAQPKPIRKKHATLKST